MIEQALRRSSEQAAESSAINPEEKTRAVAPQEELIRVVGHLSLRKSIRKF
jgi:hypothetical protein